MQTFRSGQSAMAVHTALKTAITAVDKAQHNAVLWFGEILDRGLYRELGYSSINQYAEVELHFSSSRTGDYLMLCRRLKELPQLKAVVESGELGYTVARLIAPIADPGTEGGWVGFAKGNSRRRLEQEVKRAKQELKEKKTRQRPLLPAPKPTCTAVAKPVRVALEMSPTQFARYEQLWEKIRKEGGVPGDRVEALLAVMASFGTSPRGDVAAAPVQIHVHRCPDCEQATVPTSKGELVLSEPEREHAECDCQVQKPGARNTASIPPARRREVLARYRHRCQRPGCRHTQYLEVHHVVPRSRGGSNDLENLTCLCSACHRLVHRHGMVKEPEAGYIVCSQFRPSIRSNTT